MEDYIKSEQIGGGSPRHLTHFLNFNFFKFVLLAVDYTHVNTSVYCCYC